MAFFSSLPGQYVVQAFMHSVLLAFAVEAFLKVSKVERAATRIQFRALYLVLPVIGWPIYQLIWPSRGSAQFRSSLAIFDTRQWLTLSILNVPVWAWVSGLLGLGALLFFSVILLPAIKRLPGSRRKSRRVTGHSPNKLVQNLALPNSANVDYRVVEDPMPRAQLEGIWRVRIVVTTGLIDMLDREELETVLAHEAAHASRRDNLMSWWLMITGLFMFFSPFSVLAIQRIGHDTELACDEDAAEKTRRPLSLASAIIKSARHTFGADWDTGGFKLTGWWNRADTRGRRAILVKRVRSLASYHAPKDLSFKWAKLALTGLMSATLMFFVV